MNGAEAVKALQLQARLSNESAVLSFRGTTDSTREQLRELVSGLGTGAKSVGTDLHIDSEALNRNREILAVYIDALEHHGLEVRNIGTRIVCERRDPSTEAHFAKVALDFTDVVFDIATEEVSQKKRMSNSGPTGSQPISEAAGNK